MPLKQIEYAVYGDLILIALIIPKAIFYVLQGTIRFGSDFGASQPNPSTFIPLVSKE